MRTVASTVLVGLLLCLCLHQSLGKGFLPPGYGCPGIKSKMCMPGSVCMSGRCRLGLGGSPCGPELCWIDEGRCFNGTCKLPIQRDCSRNRDMCASDTYCDPVSSKCLRAVGGQERFYCYTDYDCVSGAFCHMKRFCKCKMGVAKTNGTFCAPLAGKVGGRCLTGKRCDDPNATCKRRKCQCNDEFAVSGPDLTCKPEVRLQVEAGGSCAKPTYHCIRDTMCDTDDHICKVRPSYNCSGEKADLCLPPSVCINGECKLEMRQSCRPVYSREPCREGSHCVGPSYTTSICGFKLNGNCSEDPTLCKAPGEVCDPITLKCKRIAGGRCYKDTDCVSWATCYRRYYMSPNSVGQCRCQHSFQQNYTFCATPKGAVGTSCTTSQDCNDTHAFCNEGSGLCQCRSGYVDSINSGTCDMLKGANGAPCNSSKDCNATNAVCNKSSGFCQCRPGYALRESTGDCVLPGPKCSVSSYGFNQVFVPGTTTTSRNYALGIASDRSYQISAGIQLGIPCSFKAASFKCGKAEVDVYSTMSYKRTVSSAKRGPWKGKEIALRQISGVLVNISTTKGSSEVTYRLYTFLVKPNDAKDGVWQTTCKEGQCVGKDTVKLSFKRKSGIAELRKQLLRVTFSMAYYPVNSLLIECGSRNFRSLQRYPDVLCGSPKDSVNDLDRFNLELQREQYNSKPDTFIYLRPQAFSDRRMSDHAVLRRQHAPNSDPMCQEAADIVTGDCPALAEKMYNCSRLFEEDRLSGRYHRPNCEKVDVVKLYASCLRVMCGRLEDKLDDTCRTLQGALDVGCDTHSGWSDYTLDRLHRGVTIRDIFQMAGCPPAEVAK